MDLEWHVSPGGGNTAKGGLADEEEEEFVLEALWREPEAVFAPTEAFPPVDGTVEAKPAHLVLRGRRILWILEVVRCCPVAVVDGEGMMRHL